MVVSKRGLNVGAADDQISTAIALNPSHVFMAFGSNDLEIYGSASSEFIDAYRTQIKKIQTALPDVPIYINCILPITDEAIAQTPDLGYYPDYNEGLIKLCQEMGCTFIDNSTIVTDSSENLYEPDGEHSDSGLLSQMADKYGTDCGVKGMKIIYIFYQGCICSFPYRISGCPVYLRQRKECTHGTDCTDYGTGF